MQIAGSFEGHVVKLIGEFLLMAYYNKTKATPKSLEATTTDWPYMQIAGSFGAMLSN